MAAFNNVLNEGEVILKLLAVSIAVLTVAAGAEVLITLAFIPKPMATPLSTLAAEKVFAAAQVNNCNRCLCFFVALAVDG